MKAPSIGTPPPTIARYAPRSASSSTLKPVTLPSFSAARVSFCHWSRPWCALSSDSERVSVYFTGLLIRRPNGPGDPLLRGGLELAAEAASDVRARSTRIFDSDTPVVAARAKRRMCGIWVADHIVYCSPVGSTTTERGSMNAGISRCWRYSRSITMPSVRALAIASSTSSPVPAAFESKIHSADLLVPESGCARTLSAAASLRSSAAGSSSYSTSTSSAASRASAAVRATTTATISPANATRSDGIGECAGVTWSGVIGQALMQTPSSSPKSCPVNTSTTLVIALAALTSMP